MASDEYIALEKRVATLEVMLLNDVPKTPPTDGPATGQLDWSLNERAFVSRYAQGKSPEKKFVLIVAYLAKGNLDTNISLAEIRQMWDKMTASSLLGSKFNGKYPTTSKTKGWVNSPKTGEYQLAYGWHEVYEPPVKSEAK